MLRKRKFLKISSARSMRYGTYSILFQISLVWNKLSVSVKQSQSLIAQFKSKIKVKKKMLLQNLQFILSW